MSDVTKPCGAPREPATGEERRSSSRSIDPHANIEVTIGLKAPDLPRADAMPARALTPQEFADQYGAAPADVQKVEQVLRGFGLTVQEVDPSRRNLRVSGSAAAMEAAFQPIWGSITAPTKESFRGREGTLRVPAELEGLITGVFGLDQRRVAGNPALPVTLSVSWGEAEDFAGLVRRGAAGDQRGASSGGNGWRYGLRLVRR